ncbi:hypothetical protein F5I97DRAFT_828079 [Phlebopus sp. FC_14]|nr:hypothetical protein F5I97DRAFT_828079 [Phlebopus sp. FC_14]
MSLSSSSSSPSASPPAQRKRKLDSDEETSSDEHESPNVKDESAPAPDQTVLSHAERRRQKKKELNVQKPFKKRKLSDGTAVKSTSTSKPTTDKTKPKRQNSVWVGNLSFWTTQDALRGFFDGVGEMTRVHMPMRPGSKSENLGFAYVDFATPEAKVVAITLSEGQLDGRNLLIKDGNDFKGRPTKATEETAEGEIKPKDTKASSGLTKTAQKILRRQKQPPAPTLFLGNLGFDTTEDSIRQLFEAHRHFKPGIDKTQGKDVAAEGGNGENDVWMRRIRMGTFEDSGNCKGFAFVDFSSIEHATSALLNPRNHRLNGRDLVVEYASAEAVRRGGGGHRNPKQERNGASKHQKSGVERHTRPRRQSNIQEHDEVTTPVEGEEKLDGASSQRPTHGRHDRSHKSRAKPGAALAQAPRQSAAILPSQGRKIVF